MSVLTVRNLRHLYGRRIGIDSVNLSVSQGQLFGLLGPNGSGKTTTIRVLLGLLRPSSGTASVFDLDCWRHSHVIKRQLGYLPGDLRLYPWLTGNRAVSIMGQVRGRDLRKLADELAQRFQLDMGLPVRRMSRGMRQKLGILLATAHYPRLLVLDEPTTGLDPLMQDELATFLRARAAGGDTVIFSSHTLSEVELLCDRVAILRRGTVVADESLAVLRAQAPRVVTLRFQSDRVAREVAPPDFLDVRKRTGAVWDCSLRGPTTPLVRWAAAQPLDDLTIGSPNLEAMFRNYYGSHS